MNRVTPIACLLALLVCQSSAAEMHSSWAPPQTVEVAQGIYQFISPDAGGDVDGNSVAIVTDHDVLVFDTNVLPATAQNVLAEIRRATDRPVRYVVNSHWHPDHWDGNEWYAHEFPGVEIIASQDTRRLMENTMKVYVRTLQHQLAQADAEVERQLQTGKSSDGTVLSDKERNELLAQMGLERAFMRDYAAMHPVLPTLTFNDRLTLYHGGREFRFLHFVGHTAGDSVLYLPAEKVLLTGDLLVYPVPFCADSHPTAWIESLEALERLDATTIIPGHGQVQYDMSYLKLVRTSLQMVVRQVHEALGRAMTLEETRHYVDLASIRANFTHGDPELNAVFDGNFEPIVRQVYDEATEGLELYQ